MTVSAPATPQQQEGEPTLTPENYEASLQEFLVAALYARVGEQGTLTGEGNTARFEIKKSLGGGTCAAEADLHYALPSGSEATHTADILVTMPRGKRLAIEWAWASNDLDNFKARAFDMLQIKKSLGRSLSAMMIYLRPGTGGVSAEQAREICYPFDQFFACEHQDPQNPAIWVPMLDGIEAEISSGR
jgi:hypothetical protein